MGQDRMDRFGDEARASNVRLRARIRALRVALAELSTDARVPDDAQRTALDALAVDDVAARVDAGG